MGLHGPRLCQGHSGQNGTLDVYIGVIAENNMKDIFFYHPKIDHSNIVKIGLIILVPTYLYPRKNVSITNYL